MYSKLRLYLLKGTVLAALLFSIASDASSYETVEDLSFTETDPSLTWISICQRAKMCPIHVLVIQGSSFAPVDRNSSHSPRRRAGFTAALNLSRASHNYLDTIADNKAAVALLSEQFEQNRPKRTVLGSIPGTLAAMLAFTETIRNSKSRRPS